MARVAQSECATCHHIRPKTEMREVVVRRKSTSSYRSSWALTGKRSRSVGTRDSFRHERLFVCKGCRAPRSDRGYGGFFTASIAIAVIGLVAYPLSMGSSLMGLLPSASHVNTIAKEMRDADMALPKEKDVPKVEKRKEKISVVDDKPSAFDFSSPRIDAAEMEAATSGGNARWEANGSTGYSVASTSTFTGDIECRNVYSSVDGSGETSQARRFCREGEGSGWTMK